MSKIDFDKIIDNKLLSPPKGHPHREAIKAMMYDACIQVLNEAAGRFETNGNDPIYESVKDEILQIKEEL